MYWVDLAEGSGQVVGSTGFHNVRGIYWLTEAIVAVVAALRNADDVDNVLEQNWSYVSQLRSSISLPANKNFQINLYILFV